LHFFHLLVCIFPTAIGVADSVFLLTGGVSRWSWRKRPEKKIAVSNPAGLRVLYPLQSLSQSYDLLNLQIQRQRCSKLERLFKL
jgi:hypothetical protein